eukprot:3181337-Rhodomonas_salina.2
MSQQDNDSAEGHQHDGEASYKILAHFSQPKSNSEPSGAAIVAEGALEAVIAEIGLHGKSAEEHEHELAVKFGKRGGARTVIQWMKEQGYAASDRGASGTSETLPQANAEMVSWAKAEVDDVIAIIAVMKNSRSSPGVQEHGCRALWILAHANAQMTAHIGAQGGIEMIVSAMREHVTSATVQKHGATALGVLAHSNGDNLVQVGALGGIKAVLRGLEAHGESVRMQEHGFRALWVLAHTSDDNRVKIGSQGGIETVIVGMKVHARSASVQEHGCRALMHLALNRYNRVQIGALGGIEVVIAGMNAHGESTRAACTALGVLAINAENCVKIGAQGGIEAVISWIKQHGESVAVHEPGCTTLGILALNSDNREKIGAQGGIPKGILSCMIRKENRESGAGSKGACGSLPGARAGAEAGTA